MKPIKTFLNIITILVMTIAVAVTIFGNENKIKKFGRLTYNEVRWQIAKRQMPDWFARMALIKEERWTK